MNSTPTLSLEVLRHFDNEAIFHMVEAGVCKEAETIAAGRAVHGKWIDGKQAAAFRARQAGRALAGVIVALTALSAHAMDAEDTASTAAAADGLSTLAVLAEGGIEANPIMPTSPLGIVGVTVLKMAAPRLTRDMEPQDRKTVLQAFSGFWTFAGAQNLCVLAGPAAPVCVAVGIAAGVYAWHNTGDKVDAEIAAAQPVAVAIAE